MEDWKKLKEILESFPDHSEWIVRIHDLIKVSNNPAIIPDSRPDEEVMLYEYLTVPDLTLNAILVFLDLLPDSEEREKLKATLDLDGKEMCAQFMMWANSQPRETFDVIIKEYERLEANRS